MGDEIRTVRPQVPTSLPTGVPPETPPRTGTPQGTTAPARRVGIDGGTNDALVDGQRPTPASNDEVGSGARVEAQQPSATASPPSIPQGTFDAAHRPNPQDLQNLQRALSDLRTFAQAHPSDSRLRGLVDRARTQVEQALAASVEGEGQQASLPDAARTFATSARADLAHCDLLANAQTQPRLAALIADFAATPPTGDARLFVRRGITLEMIEQNLFSAASGGGDLAHDATRIGAVYRQFARTGDGGAAATVAALSRYQGVAISAARTRTEADLVEAQRALATASAVQPATAAVTAETARLTARVNHLREADHSLATLQTATRRFASSIPTTAQQARIASAQRDVQRGERLLASAARLPEARRTQAEQRAEHLRQAGLQHLATERDRLRTRIERAEATGRPLPPGSRARAWFGQAAEGIATSQLRHSGRTLQNARATPDALHTAAAALENGTPASSAPPGQTSTTARIGNAEENVDLADRFDPSGARTHGRFSLREQIYSTRGQLYRREAHALGYRPVEPQAFDLTQGRPRPAQVTPRELMALRHSHRDSQLRFASLSADARLYEEEARSNGGDISHLPPDQQAAYQRTQRAMLGQSQAIAEERETLSALTRMYRGIQTPDRERELSTRRVSNDTRLRSLLAQRTRIPLDHPQRAVIQGQINTLRAEQQRIIDEHDTYPARRQLLAREEANQNAQAMTQAEGQIRARERAMGDGGDADDRHYVDSRRLMLSELRTQQATLTATADSAASDVRNWPTQAALNVQMRQQIRQELQTVLGAGRDADQRMPASFAGVTIPRTQQQWMAVSDSAAEHSRAYLRAHPPRNNAERLEWNEAGREYVSHQAAALRMDATLQSRSNASAPAADPNPATRFDRSAEMLNTVRTHTAALPQPQRRTETAFNYLAGTGLARDSILADAPGTTALVRSLRTDLLAERATGSLRGDTRLAVPGQSLTINQVFERGFHDLDAAYMNAGRNPGRGMRNGQMLFTTPSGGAYAPQHDVRTLMDEVRQSTDDPASSERMGTVLNAHDADIARVVTMLRERARRTELAANIARAEGFVTRQDNRDALSGVIGQLLIGARQYMMHAAANADDEAQSGFSQALSVEARQHRTGMLQFAGFLEQNGPTSAATYAALSRLRVDSQVPPDRADVPNADGTRSQINNLTHFMGDRSYDAVDTHTHRGWSAGSRHATFLAVAVQYDSLLREWERGPTTGVDAALLQQARTRPMRLEVAESGLNHLRRHSAELQSETEYTRWAVSGLDIAGGLIVGNWAAAGASLMLTRAAFGARALLGIRTAAATGQVVRAGRTAQAIAAARVALSSTRGGRMLLATGRFAVSSGEGVALAYGQRQGMAWLQRRLGTHSMTADLIGGIGQFAVVAPSQLSIAGLTNQAAARVVRLTNVNRLSLGLTALAGPAWRRAWQENSGGLMMGSLQFAQQLIMQSDFVTRNLSEHHRETLDLALAGLLPAVMGAHGQRRSARQQGEQMIRQVLGLEPHQPIPPAALAHLPHDAGALAPNLADMPTGAAMEAHISSVRDQLTAAYRAVHPNSTGVPHSVVEATATYRAQWVMQRGAVPPLQVHSADSLSATAINERINTIRAAFEAEGMPHALADVVAQRQVQSELAQAESDLSTYLSGGPLTTFFPEGVWSRTNQGAPIPVREALSARQADLTRSLMATTQANALFPRLHTLPSADQQELIRSIHTLSDPEASPTAIRDAAAHLQTVARHGGDEVFEAGAERAPSRLAVEHFVADTLVSRAEAHAMEERANASQRFAEHLTALGVPTSRHARLIAEFNRGLAELTAREARAAEPPSATSAPARPSSPTSPEERTHRAIAELSTLISDYHEMPALLRHALAQHLAVLFDATATREQVRDAFAAMHALAEEHGGAHVHQALETAAHNFASRRAAASQGGEQTVAAYTRFRSAYQEALASAGSPRGASASAAADLRQRAADVAAAERVLETLPELPADRVSFVSGLPAQSEALAARIEERLGLTPEQAGPLAREALRRAVDERLNGTPAASTLLPPGNDVVLAAQHGTRFLGSDGYIYEVDRRPHQPALLIQVGVRPPSNRALNDTGIGVLTLTPHAGGPMERGLLPPTEVPHDSGLVVVDQHGRMLAIDERTLQYYRNEHGELPRVGELIVRVNIEGQWVEQRVPASEIGEWQPAPATGRRARHRNLSGAQTRTALGTVTMNGRTHVVVGEGTRLGRVDSSGDWHLQAMGQSAVDVDPAMVARFEAARAAMPPEAQAIVDARMGRTTSPEEQAVVMRVVAATRDPAQLAELDRLIAQVHPPVNTPERWLEVSTLEGVVQYYSATCSLAARQAMLARANPIHAIRMVLEGREALIADQVALADAHGNGTGEARDVTQAPGAPRQRATGEVPARTIAEGQMLGMTPAQVMYNLNEGGEVFRDALNNSALQFDWLAPQAQAGIGGDPAVSYQTSAEQALFAYASSGIPPEGIPICVDVVGGHQHAMVLFDVQPRGPLSGPRDPAQTIYTIYDPWVGGMVQATGAQLRQTTGTNGANTRSLGSFGIATHRTPADYNGAQLAAHLDSLGSLPAHVVLGTPSGVHATFEIVARAQDGTLTLRNLSSHTLSTEHIDSVAARARSIDRRITIDNPRERAVGESLTGHLDLPMSGQANTQGHPELTALLVHTNRLDPDAARTLQISLGNLNAEAAATLATTLRNPESLRAVNELLNHTSGTARDTLVRHLDVLARYAEATTGPNAIPIERLAPVVQRIENLGRNADTLRLEVTRSDGLRQSTFELLEHASAETLAVLTQNPRIVGLMAHARARDAVNGQMSLPVAQALLAHMVDLPPAGRRELEAALARLTRRDPSLEVIRRTRPDSSEAARFDHLVRAERADQIPPAQNRAQGRSETAAESPRSTQRSTVAEATPAPAQQAAPDTAAAYHTIEIVPSPDPVHPNEVFVRASPRTDTPGGAFSHEADIFGNLTTNPTVRAQAEALGFVFDDASRSVTYPSIDGLNRRLAEGGYQFRFYDASGVESNAEVMRHLAAVPTEFPLAMNGQRPDGQSDHLHDLGAHLAGYLRLAGPQGSEALTQMNATARMYTQLYDALPEGSPLRAALYEPHNRFRDGSRGLADVFMGRGFDGATGGVSVALRDGLDPTEIMSSMRDAADLEANIRTVVHSEELSATDRDAVGQVYGEAGRRAMALDAELRSLGDNPAYNNDGAALLRREAELRRQIDALVPQMAIHVRNSIPASSHTSPRPVAQSQSGSARMMGVPGSGAPPTAPSISLQSDGTVSGHSSGLFITMAHVNALNGRPVRDLRGDLYSVSPFPDGRVMLERLRPDGSRYPMNQAVAGRVATAEQLLAMQLRPHDSTTVLEPQGRISTRTRTPAERAELAQLDVVGAELRARDAADARRVVDSMVVGASEGVTRPAEARAATGHEVTAEQIVATGGGLYRLPDGQYASVRRVQNSSQFYMVTGATIESLQSNAGMSHHATALASMGLTPDALSSNPRIPAAEVREISARPHVELALRVRPAMASLITAHGELASTVLRELGPQAIVLVLGSGPYDTNPVQSHEALERLLAQINLPARERSQQLINTVLARLQTPENMRPGCEFMLRAALEQLEAGHNDLAQLRFAINQSVSPEMRALPETAELLGTIQQAFTHRYLTRDVVQFANAASNLTPSQHAAAGSILTRAHADPQSEVGTAPHLGATRQNIERELIAAGITPADAENIARRFVVRSRVRSMQTTAASPVTGSPTRQALHLAISSALNDVEHMSRFFDALTHDVDQAMQTLPTTIRGDESRRRAATNQVLLRRLAESGFLTGADGQRLTPAALTRFLSADEFNQVLTNSGLFFDQSFASSAHGDVTHLVQWLAAAPSIARALQQPGVTPRTLPETVRWFGSPEAGRLFTEDFDSFGNGPQSPETLGPVIRSLIQGPQVERQAIATARRQIRRDVTAAELQVTLRAWLNQQGIGNANQVMELVNTGLAGAITEGVESLGWRSLIRDLPPHIVRGLNALISERSSRRSDDDIEYRTHGLVRVINRENVADTAIPRMADNAANAITDFQLQRARARQALSENGNVDTFVASMYRALEALSRLPNDTPENMAGRQSAINESIHRELRRLGINERPEGPLTLRTVSREAWDSAEQELRNAIPDAQHIEFFDRNALIRATAVLHEPAATPQQIAQAVQLMRSLTLSRGWPRSLANSVTHAIDQSVQSLAMRTAINAVDNVVGPVERRDRFVQAYEQVLLAGGVARGAGDRAAVRRSMAEAAHERYVNSDRPTLPPEAPLQPSQGQQPQQQRQQGIQGLGALSATPSPTAATLPVHPFVARHEARWQALFPRDAAAVQARLTTALNSEVHGEATRTLVEFVTQLTTDNMPLSARNERMTAELAILREMLTAERNLPMSRDDLSRLVETFAMRHAGQVPVRDADRAFSQLLQSEFRGMLEAARWRAAVASLPEGSDPTVITSLAESPRLGAMILEVVPPGTRGQEILRALRNPAARTALQNAFRIVSAEAYQHQHDATSTLQALIHIADDPVRLEHMRALSTSSEISPQDRPARLRALVEPRPASEIAESPSITTMIDARGRRWSIVRSEAFDTYMVPEGQSTPRVNLLSAQAEAAGPFRAPGDPAPNATFLDARNHRRYAAVSHALRHGITAQQARTLFRQAGGDAVDEQLHFEGAAERIETIHRAITHLDSWGPERGFYIEADLRNLSGLTNYIGEGPADAEFGHIANIFREEIARVQGNPTFARHGGDEFSALVTGSSLTREQLDAATEAITRRVNAYVQQAMVTLSPEALANPTLAASLPQPIPADRRIPLRLIPHPKHLGQPEFYGAGIVMGVAEIVPDRTATQIFATAGAQVELNKRRAGLAGPSTESEFGQLVNPPGGSLPTFDAHAPTTPSRRPFPSQVEARRRAYEENWNALRPTRPYGDNSAVDPREHFFALAGGTQVDPLTGFSTAADLVPTARRVQERVNMGEQALHMTFLFRNLAGCNGFLEPPQPNLIITQTARLIAEAFRGLPVDIVAGRDGPRFELFLTAPNISAELEARILQAGRNATAAVERYAAQQVVSVNGRQSTLANITHPKHRNEGAYNGIGLTFASHRLERVGQRSGRAVRAQATQAARDRLRAGRNAVEAVERADLNRRAAALTGGARVE